MAEATKRVSAGAARHQIAWIEVARVAAILGVITIHVLTRLVSNRALPESWWFANIMESATRWSVPIFVMLSGALALHSDLADDPPSFYRRRLSRIVPPLIAWSAIYLLYGHVASNSPKTWADALWFVLAGRPYFHLYFLYLITGLYLVAPFLRPLVAQPSRRVLGIAVLVFLAVAMVDDLIVAVWHIGGVNGATRFVPYIGYFLAGAWLVGISPTRRQLVAAGAVVALGILLTIVGTDISLSHPGFRGRFYLYEYLSVTTVPVSLCAFLLFQAAAPLIDRVTTPWLRRGLSAAAASTLGIFVIHPLVMTALGRLGLGPRSFFVPLAAAATILATFAVSLAIVLVMRRVPGVRRLV
jgi:surface polysaccharide O-acyltransferase-like enzyme